MKYDGRMLAPRASLRLPKMHNTGSTYTFTHEFEFSHTYLKCAPVRSPITHIYIIMHTYTLRNIIPLPTAEKLYIITSFYPESECFRVSTPSHYITPVYKIRNSQYVINYRPISILSRASRKNTFIFNLDLAT